MTWDEIRRGHPHEWVIVEAIRQAPNPATPGWMLRAMGAPRVESLALRNTFRDARAAMREFCRLCAQEPQRELYVLPTDLQELDLDRHLRPQAG